MHAQEPMEKSEKKDDGTALPAIQREPKFL
jgi:hypothetical protein